MNTTKTETQEIIERAKSHIERPDSWIQGYTATDSAGHGVDAESPYAVRFCVVGALVRAVGTVCPSGQSHLDDPDSFFDRYSRAYDHLVGCTDEEYLDEWNDAPERTHQDVLDLFGAATR